MCYVQIVGMLVATLVTLVIVPVLYVIFVEDLHLVRWETEPNAHAATSTRDGRREAAGDNDAIRVGTFAVGGGRRTQVALLTIGALAETLETSVVGDSQAPPGVPNASRLRVRGRARTKPADQVCGLCRECQGADMCQG